MEQFAEYIKGETLTLELTEGKPEESMTTITSEFDSETVTLGVAQLK